MKKHILRVAEINKDTFDYIKSGKKKIETRAGSIKYRKIKEGDIIVLCCGGKKLEKKVKKVSHFKSIDAILKRWKPNQINPATKTKAEAIKAWHSYPGYEEKIKKYGLIAFEI